MQFASEFAFIGKKANVIQMNDQEVDIALQNQNTQTCQASVLQYQITNQAAKLQQFQNPQISFLSTQSSLKNPSSNFASNLSQILQVSNKQTFRSPIQQQQFFRTYQGVVHKQEVDTNVLSINMSVLQKEAQEVTGNLTSCSNCKVFLNSYSKVEKSQTWNCEFCGTQNKLQKVIKPQQELFTQVIENAKGEQLNDISIIFVIDISASMSYSSQRQYQYSPLECVKTAISQQLQSLATNYPNRYVGLITFSDKISLIGDGTQEPFIVKGQELYSSEGLVLSVRDGHKK